MEHGSDEGEGRWKMSKGQRTEWLWNHRGQSLLRMEYGMVAEYGIQNMV